MYEGTEFSPRTPRDLGQTVPLRLALARQRSGNGAPLHCGPIDPMKISGPDVAATQYPRDRFYRRLMSESRLEDPVVRGDLKCSSVPDFRRRSFALQVGGVKWTSPRHCTHTVYLLHLGGEENLRKTGQIHVKNKPGSTRPNSDGAGATPPFDAQGVTGLRGVSPARPACRVASVCRVKQEEKGVCQTRSLTICE
jgi:hypothetical protein